jgi:transcriptional regulator with XRE-family HTH domain
MEGSLVREARRRAGLTQAQLAERVGTTQSAIARVERGASSPTLARVRELVVACGLELRLRLADRVAPEPPSRNGGRADANLIAAAELVRALHRFEVRWILAGDLAAALHGAPLADAVPSVVPAEGRRNLAALVSVLDELGARVRVDGGSLPFERDAEAILAAGLLALTSSAGPFDVDLRPPGTSGFADLARDAVLVRRSGLDLLVASPADTVRMVDAAGRDDELVATLRRRLAGGLETDRR